jgi:hypothetical protein
MGFLDRILNRVRDVQFKPAVAEDGFIHTRLTPHRKT